MKATREQIITEARTWIGTSFRHAAAVKGSGVDCAHLCSEVYEALGLSPHIDYPLYGPDWFRHEECPEHILIGFAAAGLREITAEEAGVGDLVALKFGRKWSHCVILCADGRGIEAWPTHSTVAEIKLKEERLWKKSEKRFFTVFS